MPSNDLHTIDDPAFVAAADLRSAKTHARRCEAVASSARSWSTLALGRLCSPKPHHTGSVAVLANMASMIEGDAIKLLEAAHALRKALGDLL